MKSYWISAAIFFMLNLFNAAVEARIPSGCKSRNLSVTGDDFMRLFIDGREITSLRYANNWQYPDKLELPCTTRVIAIEGNDYKGVGAISASTDDGYVKTNTSWKCRNTRMHGWETVDLIDSTWSNAVVVPYHDPFPETAANIIRADAHWIWTRGYEGQDLNVFCRITLDVNDCLFGEPINHCDPSNGRCIRFPARGYNCSCYPGYTNDGQHRCKDVDECRVGTTENECNPRSGSCINIPGSYECNCYEGFTNAGDQRCEDIDECMTGSHSCSDVCINTNGSYACNCPAGYGLKSDRRMCEVVDECVAGTHNCSDECLYTNGSYDCRCPTGLKLKLDRRTCEAENWMTEVTGKVPLIATTGALVLLLLVAIVSIILVRRRRRMTKQNCAIEEADAPKKEVPTVDNALYEDLEMSDVNGSKNHIYEPVRKAPQAANAIYEGLGMSKVNDGNNAVYEELRKAILQPRK